MPKVVFLVPRGLLLFLLDQFGCGVGSWVQIFTLEWVALGWVGHLVIGGLG